MLPKQAKDTKFKLPPKKWFALIDLFVTVIVQALQYAWYYIIIDPFPSLGRLLANRVILTASTQVQLACTALLTVAAITKKWPLWFMSTIAGIILVFSVGSFFVDAAYIGTAAVETFTVGRVLWEQFNQTVLITNEEKGYQGASIAFFSIQVILDIVKVAVVLWLFREPLRLKPCFGHSAEGRSDGFLVVDDGREDDDGKELGKQSPFELGDDKQTVMVVVEKDTKND